MNGVTLTQSPSSLLMTVTAALMVAKKVKAGAVVNMKLRAWLTRYLLIRPSQRIMPMIG